MFTHSVCLCASHKDVTLHQWLIASRRFGRTVSYQCRFCTQLFLNHISLLAPKRLDDDTPEGNPTVSQLITTRTFIVVVIKAGYSSIHSTPTDPPLSVAPHVNIPNKHLFALISYSHYATRTFKLHTIIQLVPHSKHLLLTYSMVQSSS